MGKGGIPSVPSFTVPAFMVLTLTVPSSTVPEFHVTDGQSTKTLGVKCMSTLSPILVLPSMFPAPTPYPNVICSINSVTCCNLEEAKRKFANNVRPCVERNPPCRDGSIVQGSQVSPPRVYEVIVSVPLFFSLFSTRIRFAVRKYHGLGPAVDRPIDGVESRFSCSPLPYREYQPVSKFRANSTKVLSRKNMVPSFEVTEHKESCMPSLSGQKGCAQDAKP